MLYDFFAGVIAGVLGAIPFLHTNTLLQFFRGTFSGTLETAVFVVALSFSHLVFETVPSLFLFLPSENQSVNVLPNQKMVLEGKGNYALKTIVLSIIAAVSATALLGPLLSLFMPAVNSLLSPYFKYVFLLVILLYFVSDDNRRKMLLGIGVFVLSGIFAYLVFSVPLVKEPLFPLLAGFFGVPAILAAGKGAKIEIGKKDEKIAFGKKEWMLVLLSVPMGLLSTLFPALSVSILLSIAFMFLENDAKSFVVLGPAIAASKMLSDFFSSVSIGKSRSMVAVFTGELTRTHGTELSLVILAFTALSAAALSSLALLGAYGKIVEAAVKIEIEKLRIIAFVVIVAFILFMGGFEALFVLSVSASIGMLPMLLKIRRGYAVGALMLPSLVYLF